MSKLNTATESLPADIETVESLLAELELPDLVAGETANSDEPIIEEEFHAADEDVALDDLSLGDDELNMLEGEIARQEAYAEQENETNAEPAQPAAAAATAPKTTKTKTKTAGTPRTSTPRAAKDMSSVSAEFFVLEGDTASMDQAALDAAKTATIALQPSQKKIAEKFENLFIALAAGKKPSVFVVQAFTLLDEKKSVSSADLVGAFKTVGSKSDTEGYDEGTARSQTGQIMTLFAAVKIASRSGQSLSLNTNSLVAERLRKVLA